MVTQTTYRQRAAKLLDQYFSGTATSGSSGTSSLIDATSPLMSSNTSASDQYSDWFLFRPAAVASGDKVRIVTTYTPTTGTLTVDNTYTNAAYSGSGESYELHGLVEPLTEMNDLINETLKRIQVVREFTVTVSSNTAHRFSLASAASWLLSPSWIFQVGWLGTGDVRADTDPFDYRPVRHDSYIDGSVVYLYTPENTFNTTDTIYVRALCPAYDFCMASGGAFGDRSGLRAGTETDAAYPNEEWVAWGILNEMWDRKYNTMADRFGQEAQRSQARAAELFSKYQEEYLEAHKPKRQQRPLMPWGGRRVTDYVLTIGS